VLVGLSAGTLRADVSNGNFLYLGGPDDPNSGPGYSTLYAGSASIPGWYVSAGANNKISTGSVDWIGTYWVGPPTGGLSVDLDGTSPGQIYQFIATNTGQSYDLNFWLSGNPGGLPDPKAVLVGASGNAPQVYTVLDTQYIPNWTPYSLPFTATFTQTEIVFSSLTLPAPSGYDNNAFGPVVGGISVTSVTPEPGFYGLLALGLSGLGVFVRGRSRP
jgi:hypothetical protein